MTLVVNRHDHCREADGIQTVLLYDDQSHVLRDLLMSGSMAQYDGVDRYRPEWLYQCVRRNSAISTQPSLLDTCCQRSVQFLGYLGTIQYSLYIHAGQPFDKSALAALRHLGSRLYIFVRPTAHLPLPFHRYLPLMRVQRCHPGKN